MWPAPREYEFTFMTAASSLIGELRGSLNEESARIQREFAASGDGRSAVAQRTELIEGILQRLWLDLISPEADKPRNFALVATGGFGRGWLFPYSDIDLLFLFSEPGNAHACRVRALRPQQHRVHHFPARLPLSRG